MSQEQATVAEEEYLQIIYWLQEAGLPITGANIARAMQVSAPTTRASASPIAVSSTPLRSFAGTA